MHNQSLIELIGEDAEIAGIGQWLEQNGRRLVRSSIEEPVAAGSGERIVIRLFVIGPTTSARAISQRLRHDNREGVATAGCVAPQDRTALSKALALGLDDVLVFDRNRFPLASRQAGIASQLSGSGEEQHDGVEDEEDDHRLHRQLRHLALLACARMETVMRDSAARMLRPVPGGSRTTRPAAGPVTPPPLSVLLVGPPSQAKVRINEALGPVSVSHAETVAAAQRILTHERFDIAVLGAHDERSQRTVQAWPVTDRRSDPLVIGIVDRKQLAGEALEAWMQRHRVMDAITTSMTLEEVRLHLHFWQEFARVRARLLGHSQSMPADACSEQAPGAVSRDFFQACVEQRRKGGNTDLCPVFTLRLEDLWDIGEEHGYDTAGELLGRMVSSVLESLSMFDLAAYCGNGQLIVILGSYDDSDDPLAAAARASERALAKVRKEVGDFEQTHPHFSAEPQVLVPEIDLSIQLHALLGMCRERRMVIERRPVTEPEHHHVRSLEPA